MGRIHDALKKAAEERERKRGGSDEEVRSDSTPRVSPSARSPLTATPSEEFRIREPEPTRAVPFGAEAKTASEAPTLEFELPAEPVPMPREGRREQKTEVFEDPVSFEELMIRGKPVAARRAVPVPVRERRELTDTETRQRAHGLDERIVAFHNPRDERSEQFRVLRANLLSLRPTPKSILITSAVDDEICGLVVANLASALSEETTKRVLIVDANLRTPRMAKLLNVEQAPGFRELIEGTEKHALEVIRRTAIPGVDIIPGGEIPRNPGGYIVSRALAAVIEAVEENYDYILVEAPALHQFADAAVMAPESDGVLLVVRIAGVAKSQSERAIDALESARARILGSVVMDAR